MPDEGFTHLDAEGRARMVDVSAKDVTLRRAVAEGRVRMRPKTLTKIRAGEIQKGDALAVARIAGLQGAKRTSDLVPLCHPIRIEHVQVDVRPSGRNAVAIRAEVIAHGRTGVEMEALTAVTAAALALYDMIKGVDRTAQIAVVQLLSKEGGRTGAWKRPRT